MSIIGIIFVLALLAGGVYLSIWAVKRTLADDKDKNRRQRRSSRAR